MPIVDLAQPDIKARIDTPAGFAVTPGKPDLDHGSDAPQFLSTLGAAFRDGNLIGAAVTAEDRNSPIYQEPGFKAWDSIKGTKYEKNWNSFVDVRNTQAAEDKKRQLDNEEENRKTLDAAPWYHSVPAQIIAGTLDLPTLIPGGAFVRGASGGISIARTAATTAGAAGVATLAQEAGLQKIQSSRPLSESAINVGASVFLGGLLGAGGAKVLSKIEWDRSVRDTTRNLHLGTHVPGVAVDGHVLSEGGVSGDVIAGYFPRFVEAYHGSPHDFDKFDMSRVGSGEGAQAYGHGLYFAESPGVAESYKRPGMHSYTVPTLIDGQPVSRFAAANAIEARAADALARNPTVDEAVKFLQQDSDTEAAQAWLTDNAKRITDAGKTGRLYQVRINADKEHFLDWEKPVAQQSAYVRGALEKLGLDSNTDGAQAYRRLGVNVGPLDINATLARESAASSALREAGIPGIKYLDQGSRDKGRGSHNFVVFDDKLLEITHKDGTPIPVGNSGALTSAGAAAVEPGGRGGNTIAGKMAGSVAAATARLNPALRILQSHSAATRDIGTKLFENSLYLKKNLDGIASEPAAETLMKEWNGGLAKAIKSTDSAFADYKKGGGDLSRSDFKEAVGKAMRRADESDIPEVAKVAKEWRAQVFDPLKQAAIDAKLLPPDVTVETAASYFTRMWNRNKLIAREGEFKDVVQRWVDSQAPKWAEEFDRETLATSAKLKDDKLKEYQVERRIEREARFDDPRQAGIDVANDVFNTLTGKVEKGVRPEFMTVSARGPLKERTFNIPDHLVEDFLEHDVDLVGRRYTRVMGADVELANKFGSPDMKEAIQKVRDDYAKLRVGLDDEKKLMKMGEAEKADIRDLEGLRDLLRGTRQESPIERNYGRIVRGLNIVNYIRSMGEVVLASITDAVRPAMVHGLGDYMHTVAQLATNIGAIKLSNKEAQLAGNVLEGVLGHRLATISEIIDPYASRGPVEAFLENMTNVGSKWNGIRVWTDMMKSVASVMTQNRILAGSLDFSKIRPKEKSYLAYLGIDESMADRIAKQFGTHGETVNGVKVANTEEWTDKVAVRTYRAAMNKDVDSIIVQKSVADVPLFASTPTGKALLQFKTFALASHQKVLLRGLQEDQSRFIGGTIAMTAMGMLITYLKALSGNRPEIAEKATSNPGWWIGEGLDRSGVLSVPMEIANTFEKASGYNPIKSPLRGTDDSNGMSQKVQNRSLIGSIAGPSAGMIDDAASLFSVPKKLIEGDEISKGQMSAAERLMPFNSYTGMRQMLRYVINPQD